ncbi:MAG: beta-ketoacyl-ACP synthase III [Rubrivivax sp.]|nr:beta-ketoacyl-ACP synthase III [Rubrivivax sp.]
MPNVVISGTGLYTPPQVITNAELVESYNAYADLQNARNASRIAAGECQPLVHSSVEFIEKASGIKQRHVIDKAGVLDPQRMKPRFAPRPDDQPSLMAEIAADAGAKALVAAGRSGSDVDGVLCAAANMQRAYPAMACEIQHALGCGGYAFDMNVACSSATFAIEQAVNAVRGGSARCVLIVNPEITSAHLEWRDRDCHFIFGDVCTAIVVEAEDNARSSDRWRVLGTRLQTQYSNHIRNNAGFLNRCEDTDPDARDKTFMQEGRKVFKEVVPLAAAHIQHHLADLGHTPQQVRRYWLHQANLGMNQLVMKKLVDRAVDDDIAPLILGEYANTASAGSIIAFHAHHADMQPGELGVICSFGAGYSIGSVVVQRV